MKIAEASSEIVPYAKTGGLADVVGTLPLYLEKAQSTVSQHLKELKNVGLITGDIDGPRVCYCIDLKKWKEAKKIVNLFLSQDVTQANKPC